VEIGDELEAVARLNRLTRGELSGVGMMQSEYEDGVVARPSASTPLGTALSDFAGRKPSEIPSRTQSVSAFLPGKVSMGTPFLRLIPLQGMPPLPVNFSANKKIER
jgi:hypothetical protein